MKVLLINLPSLYIYDNTIDVFSIFPAGFLSITELVKKNSVEFYSYDFNQNWGVDYLERFNSFVEDIKEIDLILVSLRHWDSFFFPEGFVKAIPLKEIQLPMIINILKIIKDKFNKNKVILGGGAVTVYKKELMKALSGYVDFFVTGRGENKLESFGLRSGYSLPNLDQIEDYEEIGVPTHIGCENSCIYCPYPSIEGKDMFYFSIPEIIDALKKISSKNKRIFFADSVFNSNIIYTKKLLRKIITENINIEWRAYFNPSYDTELLDLIKKSGCSKIIFSPDSLDEKTAERLGKPFSFDSFNKMLKNVLLSGIPTTINLLINHPWDDKIVLKKTFKFIEKIQYEYDSLFNFWISPLRIMPNTPIYNFLKIKNKNLLNPHFLTDTPLYKEIIDSFLQAFRKQGNPVVNNRYNSFFNEFKNSFKEQ
ncbi:MAG: B12-binding domain-containing radical SAM protein [Candidatus Odinarchaeia archaeon]